MTQQDLANRLGVSKGRVSQMKASGMPVDTFQAAKAWYDENVDQRMSPKLIPGIQMPPKEQLAAIVESAYDIQSARAKREHHEANLAELRERQARGELVEADKVRRAVVALSATARSGFERIPDKMPTLTDKQRAELIIELDQVMADLATRAESLKLEDAR